MDKIVSKLLESRLQSHIFHLRVSGKGAYQVHVTLEEYYTAIVDLVDELVETYQGKYKFIHFDETYKITNDATLENIIEYFENLIKVVQNYHTLPSIVIQVEGEDGFLTSHIDDIQSLIYKTIYKLKNLG